MGTLSGMEASEEASKETSSTQMSMRVTVNKYVSVGRYSSECYDGLCPM